jgi:KUP system potassium uptake protein
VIPAILGATTLLADGIITPPISVASAIEGLGMVRGLETVIVPGGGVTICIVLIILSLLFFFQRYGTQAIGKSFGPIMIAWFTMLLVIGVSQIIKHPGVLQAFSPYYAYNLLVNYPHGFWLLGAVFLCTTGAEALYSDLGHCGIRNIRITWGFVKVCLMASYMGQAAWLMSSAGHSLSERNPFFEIVPSWFLLPSILIATAAAIIASQALISGSFTLISEVINLNFWPRVSLKQPTNIKGQVYIPSVNTILWIGCVLMVLYFEKSEHMEAAYGFSITITMLMTTVLLSYFLLYRLKWKKVYVAALLSLFAVIEVSFFVANAVKIKERWMFLFFELFIFLVMYTWYFARKVTNRLTGFTDLGRYSQQIATLSADDSVPVYATHLIYLTKANTRHQVEEKIINSILDKKPKRAGTYWFLHLNRTEDPYTLNYEVTELVDDTVIKATINIGFRIQPKTELYFKQIVNELVANRELNIHNRPDGSTPYNAEPDFRFVFIDRFLSEENEFALREGLLLRAYFFLKKLGQKESKAFGIDRHDLTIEHIPLIYQPAAPFNLIRKYKQGK